MIEIEPHILRLFSPHLDEGENIIYVEDNKWKRGPFQNDTLLATSVGICITAIYINPYLIIPIIVFALVLFRKPEQGRLSTFALTRKKVIIINKNKIVKYIYLSEINKIDNTKFKIIIERQFKNIITQKKETEIIKITPKERASFVKKRLVNYWARKSTYAQMNKVFKSYATKHNLSFIPFRRSGSRELYLSGAIGERKFSLSLNSMFNLRKLDIKIYCKLQSNNSLTLFHKSDTSWLQNIVGIEDHLIGEHWFDEKYIIQGNHQPFTEFILGKDILDELDQKILKLKGKLIIGNQEENNSSYSNTIKENQTLDEHLLIENNSIPYKEEEIKSALNFTTHHLQYESDLSILAEDIIEVIELLIKLEERIQVYFKK